MYAYLKMLTLAQLLQLQTTAILSMQSLTTGGQARVIVDQNGERVEYFATNLTSLNAYLMALAAAIAAKQGTTPCYNRPVEFLF